MSCQVLLPAGPVDFSCSIGGSIFPLAQHEIIQACIVMASIRIAFTAAGEDGFNSKSRRVLIIFLQHIRENGADKIWWKLDTHIDLVISFQ